MSPRSDFPPSGKDPDRRDLAFSNFPDGNKLYFTKNSYIHIVGKEFCRKTIIYL